MTEGAALRFIEEHGIVLEAARGPVPSLADVVLGKSRRGSWWAHPRSNAFFLLTRQIRVRKDVLVCRLVDGKITYVHRRVWPALARLVGKIAAERVAAIREVHTETGAHRVTRTSFRKWVASDVLDEAATLSVVDALAQLGPCALRR